MKKLIAFLFVILCIITLILSFNFFKKVDDTVEHKNKTIVKEQQKEIEHLKNEVQHNNGKTKNNNNKKETEHIVRMFVENYFVIKRDQTQLENRNKNLKSIMTNNIYEELFIGRVDVKTVENEHDIEGITVYLNEDNTKAIAEFNQYRVLKDGRHTGTEKNIVHLDIEHDDKILISDVNLN